MEPFYVLSTGQIPIVGAAMLIHLSKLAWLSTCKDALAHALLNGLVITTWRPMLDAARGDAVTGAFFVDFGDTGSHSNGHGASAEVGDDFLEKGAHVFAKLFRCF